MPLAAELGSRDQICRAKTCPTRAWQSWRILRVKSPLRSSRAHVRWVGEISRARADQVTTKHTKHTNLRGATFRIVPRDESSAGAHVCRDPRGLRRVPPNQLLQGHAEIAEENIGRKISARSASSCKILNHGLGCGGAALRSTRRSSRSFRTNTLRPANAG